MSIESDFLVLYGTNETWHDPDHSFNVLVFTSSDDAGIVQLRSASHGDQYLSSMTALKTAIAKRGEDYNGGSINDIEWRRWLTRKWLPQAQSFCSQWSSAHVPTDIRTSINDIRLNLGLQAVTWPTPLRLRTFADGTFHLVPQSLA